jgi:Icc protein
MPISLPPISRRRFLSRSLLASFGLAATPRLFSQASARDEDTWALLADTHIPANRAIQARGINMADHLAVAGRELAALTGRPAGVFVVGDLAYSSGEKNDYATLTGLLEPVRKAGLPVHLALGNHDHRGRFWEVLESEKILKRPVTDRQAVMIPSPRASWYVMDSLETTLSTPGLLGQDQLDWLAKSLDENRDKPALILVHHNPGIMDNIGLKDTEALFNVIRPRKQVKAYFFGHTHRWGVTEDESGIHLVNLPPVAYVFQQASPSGWIKAGLREDGMRLELRCIDPAHQSQGQITELRWRS